MGLDYCVYIVKITLHFGAPRKYEAIELITMKE